MSLFWKHWGADNCLTDFVIKILTKQSIRSIVTFDDPLLWEGHSKIITEIIDQSNYPTLIKLRGHLFGRRGGLYNGIVEGLENHKEIPVLAIETKQAATFTRRSKKVKLFIYKKCKLWPLLWLRHTFLQGISKLY